ncbi:tetratricopeptide repeat protein [Bradyrhizobium canariense]|uniref:Tetratricopeptide repeat-containing protein n=1 Tax=Bradyrhizobium canariense TaxID=255045 RepID=A0A1H1MI24_9BRAD|nr:tetratricopeptide repeat protein [Bradyrhizobium canariense]SDR86290.1 Tetratricopeptide repeat-containing protein [Bradyrhizobium canariense]
MARTAAAGFWSLIRASAWNVRRCLSGRSSFAAVLILLGSMTPAICQTDPVKGEATFAAADGYARLVLKMADDVDSEVTTAGSILVIRFKHPVDIPIDTIADSVPDYIGSARRDPDGMAIRLSLARRVTINTMSAGERIFVDLLPDTWTGPPPSLPQDVIRELAERARAAERALRLQRAAETAKKRPPIRVRALIQPTFVRFVFEMPDGVSVSSVLNDQKLTLVFNAVLNFDLADAKVAAPPNIASINQKVEGDTSAVEVLLIGDVDVHSFREDKNYIVDVAFQPSEKPSALLPVADASRPPAPSASASSSPASSVVAPAAAASVAPAPAVPPAAGPAMSEKPADKAPQQAGEAKPLTSEKFAKEAGIEIKPEAAPQAPPAPATQSAVSPASETPAPVPVMPKINPAASETPGAERSASETPAPVPAAPASAAASAPLPEAAPADSTTQVKAVRDSEGLHVTFSFAAATPAALFRRADTVWMVFDATKPIDIEPIRSNVGAIIAEVKLVPLDTGQAIRIRLNRPQMPSLTSGDQAGNANWTLTFADTMQTPTQPLTVTRNVSNPTHANVEVPLSKTGRLHRLVDPEAGDTLMVITATPPVRGFIKRQDFVELSLLESIHGVAVRPNADDITAEIAPDKITLSRPGGLTLSPVDVKAERAPTAARPMFDVDEWRKNREGEFIVKERALIQALAATEPDQRTPARIDLARFYLARGLYPEAKGVLDLALADAKPGSEDPVALVLHSAASILMGRPALGVKDLANPAIGTKYDSQLWKAMAYARQGKWVEAREKFKNVEFAITALPIDLQRVVISDVMRASLEVKDYSGADKRSSDLEVVGLTPEIRPAISVMRGRLAEALGHEKDALSDYRIAIESSDRAAAAEGKIDEITLLQKRNEISQADALRQLETLEVMWRGDGLDVRALEMMARIYSDTGRYGESLAAARTATKLDPNSEVSRQGQDASAALFSDIFLGSKGDNLPPVDALGLFYEFRELTPIGRRGDEMIRRLADRLVAVDLLDQASELLQYQVDHRLEGAARAQVAARLAMVYLTNRKPDRAISALRTTRISDLSGELRQQRLLLEARAESDVGRHDLALDIISNINGREAIRLRSDIYWAARRWRESAEQIELYYGDRWRDFKPLNPAEKGDVIRAVVGYALAEDAIGMARFREKYAPLMSGDADRAAFETASKPAAASSSEFTQIAKMAASVDTLDGFLREMKARFPDAAAKAAALQPETQKADPLPTGSLPEIVGVRRVGAAR